MEIDELKELIRQTVTQMYSEIAYIANETANSTGNMAGFDTKVWGKPPNKKKGLYSLDDEDE